MEFARNAVENSRQTENLGLTEILSLTVFLIRGSSIKFDYELKKI